MSPLYSLPLAVAVDPTTEKIADWAIKAPLTVAFFALLFAVGYLGRWLMRTAWPEWQEAQEKRRADNAAEAEKTRQHLSEVLKQRGQEAAEDVARERQLAAEQHRVLVDGIAGRVDKIDGKVDAVHGKLDGVYAVVRALATKHGVGVLAVVLLGAAALLVALKLLAPAAAAYNCNPKCAAPEYCCHTDVCCRKASAVAACPSPPHSSGYVRFDYGDGPFSERDGRSVEM